MKRGETSGAKRPYPLDDNHLPAELPRDLLRRQLGPLGVRHVVDGDVGALGGELLGDEGAEAAVRGGWLICKFWGRCGGWGCGEGRGGGRVYREPPVMRTLRFWRE